MSFQTSIHRRTDEPSALRCVSVRLAALHGRTIRLTHAIGPSRSVENRACFFEALPNLWTTRRLRDRPGVMIPPPRGLFREAR